ncbi:MAG: hypothetical protein J0M04_20390 [Verrucomicrobia bacterium]|nr:hypothetical protein [Verrucomicrobiota bacterium]
MIRTASVRILSFLAIALVAFPMLAKAAAGYRPPNLEKEIFDVKKISLDKFDRSGLVSALIAVARDFDDKDKVDYEVRGHALAIAYRLDKDNDRIKKVLDQLKEDGETQMESNDKERCSKRLSSGIRTLIRKKDVEANMVCAAYICDLALRFDPKGDSVSKIKEYQETVSKAGHKADWKDMLGKVIVPPKQQNPFGMDEPEEKMEKKEVTMPGGTAKTFAKNQSHANGLVVRQLEGGNFAGSASTVNATALAEKGVDGLLFTFNQEVGGMMGGSLEEVIKFLRVRYEPTPEKIPSGYKIELGFQDKYVPKDGPSAATLFTLVLDSLFSGEELDDGFACTGDITADGMVQKIGGTAGKIRGATKRGCKIVGIPEGNGKEVADVLLMDGPEQLLNIQIFTMKDFAQAHAISRKTKTSEVQTVLDAFAKIADVVKEKGFDTLKNSEVQTRLQGIVDRMPNHLSAKLLMEFGKDTHPKVLSIGGSFKEIQGASNGIFRQMSMMIYRMRGGDDEKDDDKQPEIKVSDEQKKDAKESLETLKKMQEKIDPKLKEFTKVIIETCEVYVDGPKADEKPKAYLERMKDALEKVQSAQQKIQKDPDVMEDLMD